jgi:uncharacterized SAM-binding protein YcdF (DUF218 family)
VDRFVWLVAKFVAFLTFPAKYFFADAFFRVTGQNSWPGIRDPKVQAVFCVGRGIPGGVMTPAQEANISLAVEMYSRLNRVLPRYLCLTGGYTENNNLPGKITEADVMALFARQRGIREGDIIIDRRAIDTEASLEWAKYLMENYGWSKGILAADLIHVPRIKWFLLRKHGLQDRLEVISSVWDVRRNWTRAVHDLIWEGLSITSLHFPESLVRKLRGY